MKTETINWIEIAKYNYIMGYEWEEAYACNHLTPEEEKQYIEWKLNYLEVALKDCPF